MLIRTRMTCLVSEGFLRPPRNRKITFITLNLPVHSVPLGIEKDYGCVGDSGITQYAYIPDV